MLRIALKTKCLASISLVLGQTSLLWADDGYILQPKIQRAVVAPNETGQEALASQNATIQQSNSAVLLLAPIPLLEGKPASQQNSLNLSQTTTVQPEVPSVAEPTTGLVWVKRGSPGASISTVAVKPEQRWGALETILPAEANALPANALPANALPANALPANALPANALPANQQPNLKTPVSTAQSQNIQQPEIATTSAPNNGTRAQLASMISKKILGESSPPKHFTASGSPLMGPAAVERELTNALTRSEQLCRRGVFLSAREEAKSAELQLARYLDSISNSFQSEPKLRAAQVALREAADFSQPSAPKILPELISAHETPVLKDVNVSQASPLALMQSYYQYAESMLVEGSQQHPWYSDVFYTLGRTYQAEADSNKGDLSEHLRAQAIVYYRAASTIRPTNALATNQLGYVLLQFDRPVEAMTSLIASVDTKLDVPALKNLAEASRRLGDQQMQRWALNQIASFNQRNPRPQGQNPAVVELDNASFAATTPVVPFNASTENRTASLPAGNLR